MNFHKFKINKNTICYFIIYILFLINVLFNMKSMYLWNDESFTFHMIHHSFLSIIYLTSLDVHPFLYYFIAKIGVLPFNKLTSQIVALRIISALPYLILLIIGNTTIKHRFSNTIAILFMFSTISMPILIQNIYQVRMYGWATLFTTIVFILFYYISKNILSNSFKTFFVISLFSLLASYTHYYALITVALIYGLFFILFILNHTKIRYLLSSAIFDGLLYIPQFFILCKQAQTVSKDYWTPPTTIKSTIQNAINIFNPIQSKKIFLIFGLLIALVILFIIIKTWKNLLSSIHIGLALPFVILLIGAGLSMIIGHTVLILRYLAPTMSIFWLCTAIILGQIMNKTNITKVTKISMFSLIILLGLSSYTANLHQVHKASSQFSITLQNYHKIPKNSEIIYDNSVVMYSASSYLQNNKVLGKRYNDVLYPVYKKVFDDINNENSMKLPNKKNVYFIRTNSKNRKNNIYESKLSNKFYSRYKNKMIKLYKIYLISDGGESTIYKICK